MLREWGAMTNKNQYEYCKNEVCYDTDISKYSIEEIINDFFDNL